MKRVLVVGDVIADVYRDVTTVPGKFCPDAPAVPVAVESSRREVRPGGAANVAANVAELLPDAIVDLIGVVSPDVGHELRRRCHGRVWLNYSCRPDDPGIVKERLYVDGNLTLRVDSGHASATGTGSSFYDRLLIIDCLQMYFANHSPDIVILSEYGCGTIDDDILTLLLYHCRDRLVVDTKRADLSVFSRGGRTFMVKLNELEWRAASAIDDVPEQHFTWMVVTRGERGAQLVARIPTTSGSFTHTMRFPAHDVPVVDVCGSGDTFVAALAAGLLTTEDVPTAVEWGNAAAATVVGESRTAIASREKMFELLGRDVGNEAR